MHCITSIYTEFDCEALLQVAVLHVERNVNVLGTVCLYCGYNVLHVAGPNAFSLAPFVTL